MLKQRYVIIQIAEDLSGIPMFDPAAENVQEVKGDNDISVGYVQAMVNPAEVLRGTWAQETVLDTTDEVREHLSGKEHPERFIALPILVYDPVVTA